MGIARHVGVGLVAALGLALAACSPKADGEGATGGSGGGEVIADSAIPKPKIGKWKMTMNIPGMAAAQSVSVCLTPEMLEDMNNYAKASGQTNCSENSTRREGAAVVTKAVCESHGVKSTIVTRAQGDFDSRYTVETSISSDPPSPTGPSTTSTLAEFVGPC
jgi:Protein of unknown function (DUF3617)